MINMLKALVEKVYNMNGQVGDFRRKIETIIKNNI